MTEKLTRLARVIRDCTWTDYPEYVADAVMRELGLQELSRTDAHGERWHRYVTDWQVAE